MKFHIGICAYNEEKTIDKLLKTLTTENYKNELGQIFIVCSGCTDNTEEIVKYYSEKFPNIILIHETKRYGKPSAINKILSYKLAPVIIFIAADNIPVKGSIDKLLEKLHNKKVGGVNGHPVPINGFKLGRIIWKLHHHFMINEDKFNKLKHLTGEFCAFRPTFSTIPLNIINDDAWIAQKLKDNNYKIIYEQDAISYFKSPHNIFEYMNQRTRIAFGYRQIKQNTFFGNLFQEPINTIKVIISALREINPIHFFYILFLELLCILRSIFYRKGVFWE